MQKIFLSSCLSLSLLVFNLSAKNCIKAEELNVEFNNASTRYSDDSEKQEIINFANFMKNTDLYAIIEGHTSSKDIASYNYELSTKRAVKVMNELKRLGVKDSHIKAMGFGETSPLYDNNTEDGAAKNRRVVAEIFNSSKELKAYMKSQSSRVKDILLKEQ